MKLHLSLLAGTLLLSGFLAAQDQTAAALTDDQLITIAHQRGIADVDIPGFIRHYRGDQINFSEQRTFTPSNAAPLNLANPGFETGNFTGWTGYIGDNTTNSNGPLDNIQSGIFSSTVDAPVSDMNARHTIVTPAFGPDPISAELAVPPGYGNYTARLGNTYANYQGEILEQVFQVTNAQPYIKFNYSVILNDGGHLAGESPYFTYILLDSLGDTIAYHHDEMVNNPSGYLLSTSASSVYYLPWQNDSVNLAAYVGQNLTLRFITAGCIYSGHYGYCYVDVSDPASLNGMAENHAAAFAVFPNPGSGTFFITMKENAPAGFTPVVTDLAGRKVAAAATATTFGWQLDLSAQPAGTYLVTLSDGNTTSTQRIIVK